MPIFTGIILARSPSTTKTTSIGLGASLAFLLALAEVELVGVAAAATSLVFAPTLSLPSFLFLSLGRRVVTLAIGTESTLVWDRVSISAVTDIPGRKISFSLTRILTSNLVASWLLPVLPPGRLDFAELAISDT